MPSDIVKIKLRSGEREIEIEGGRTDVDALLSKWWVPADAHIEGHNNERRPKSPKRPAASLAARKRAESEGEEGFNPTAFANEIKELPNFDTIQTNVLHAKDQYNKLALVCWHVDKPITSGQIQKTLAALRIRMRPQNVTKTLRLNERKFAVDESAGKRRLTLTSAARSAFEKWLKSDAE